MEIDLQDVTRELFNEVKVGLQRRTVSMSNELRNSALRVLRGQRTGRRYNVPFTGRMKYNRKTKTATITYRKYTASAPGEPPAVRTGALRLSWRMTPNQNKGDGHFNPAIETNIPYAQALEAGTKRMEPRPYRARIIADAYPAVVRIMRKPFLGGKI